MGDEKREPTAVIPVAPGLVVTRHDPGPDDDPGTVPGWTVTVDSDPRVTVQILYFRASNLGRTLVYDNEATAVAVAQALAGELDWTQPNNDLARYILDNDQHLHEVVDMCEWPAWSRELEAELMAHPVIRHTAEAMAGLSEDVTHFDGFLSRTETTGQSGLGSFGMGAVNALTGRGLFELLELFPGEKDTSAYLIDKGYRMGACIVDRALRRGDRPYVAEAFTMGDDHEAPSA